MRTKTKLTLGIGFLFVLIIVLAIVGMYNINALSDATRNTMEANHRTLEYARAMLMALDGGLERPENRDIYRQNLDFQQQNITEPGEQEATATLARYSGQLLQNPTDNTLHPLIRGSINTILEINLEAISQKSARIEAVADTSIAWIATSSTLCFLIAFVLLFNLPGSIADPLRELTDSILQIAHRNYGERVQFDPGGEFGELAEAFNTMAAKLEEYDKSTLATLLAEKKRTEAILDNLTDPVLILDENRKIVFANGSLLDILDQEPKHLLGRPAQDVAVQNDLLRTLLQQLEADSGRTARRTEPLKIYADGKESYFTVDSMALSIMPTGERQTRPVGHVIILKNVTPFKELDFAKTNFLATISHELKTPISSIQMSSRLLRDGRVGVLNTEQQRLAESIEEDSRRLLGITGELLNMTQVEAGQLQLNVRPTPVDEVVRYALNATRNQAEQKAVAVEQRIAGQLPAIQTDADKTAWVLTNLLSNAIRYTPENNRVVLSVELRDEAVHFAVQDFGRGIETQYLDKLFNRYFRVPGSDKAGSGLGLAISKEFVEALGGKIAVESSFGSGSTFRFSLPAVEKI